MKKRSFDYGVPRIEFEDLDWLAARPWPKNAKKHDLSVMGEFFAANGFAEMPILDERTGKMVAGHGRVEKLVAMRDARESPPARVDVRDGKWFVPVVRGMRFPEPGKHVLASNRGVELGGWDDELLSAVLTDIGKDDLIGTGFGADDFASFMAKPDDEVIPEIKSSFSVLVECESEKHQTQLIKRFQKEGLTVKALIS